MTTDNDTISDLEEEQRKADELEWDLVSTQIGDTLDGDAGTSLVEEEGTIVIDEEKWIALINLVIELRRAEGDRAYKEYHDERKKLVRFINLLRSRMVMAVQCLKEANQLISGRMDTLDGVLKHTEDYSQEY